MVFGFEHSYNPEICYYMPLLLLTAACTASLCFFQWLTSTYTFHFFFFLLLILLWPSCHASTIILADGCIAILPLQCLP
jgi:hypothetical protein